jgi:hypothetical protein
MLSRFIAIVALLASCVALGQVEKPIGIKIGDGRLHPYFDLEGRYDSAVGYFGNPPTLQGDIAVRFRPGLRFELLGSDNTVNFNGNAEYVLFTGALSSGSREASRFQTDVGLDAAFNKTGAVEFQIGDQLVRSDRNNNPIFTIGVLSLYNSLRVAVPIHPGGGALEVTPKAAWAVEFFQPLIGGQLNTCPAGNPACQSNLASSLNYSNLNLGLGARWRFLPKTAIVFDGGVDYRTYFNGGNRPATLMKLQAGLAGLVSSKISVLLLAGYGRDFIGANGASTFIAQAELGVLLSEITTFKFGYVRTLSPVPLYGVFGDDRGYLEAKTGIGRFSLLGSAAFDFLTFYGDPTNPLTPARQDSIFTLGVTPSVAIFSWFSVALAYNLNLRLSSANALPGSQFTRHEVILRLSFTY